MWHLKEVLRISLPGGKIHTHLQTCLLHMLCKERLEVHNAFDLLECLEGWAGFCSSLHVITDAASYFQYVPALKDGAQGLLQKRRFMEAD